MYRSTMCHDRNFTSTPSSFSYVEGEVPLVFQQIESGVESMVTQVAQYLLPHLLLERQAHSRNHTANLVHHTHFQHEVG